MTAIRIEEKIFEKKREKGIGIIPYICAWDPDLSTTEKILWEFAELDLPCVELGFPFSDPVADGPTIQKAIVRALHNNPTFEAYLEFVENLNERGYPLPILCMTYYNILFKYGLKRVIEDSVKARLSGFIIPDLPLEESDAWINEIKKIPFSQRPATVFLVTPVTPISRVKRIAARSSGFLYYVSVAGITGARDKLPPDIVQNLKKIKSSINLPLGVGFGISKKEHIELLSPYADAVIIGSAIVKLIEKEKAPWKPIRTFLKSLMS